MNEVVDRAPGAENEQFVVRHRLIDRLFHWITAAAVLTLLFTALLPIMGLKFSWVTPHWVSGFVLILVISFHIVRTCVWRGLRPMYFGPGDIREIGATLGWLLKLPNSKLIKPGKYSPAQKLMHHGVSLIVLVTIITGILMMVKIDTPWWDRDLYWLTDQSWGIVYVLHGFAALFLLAVVMIHIYFAIRPEKMMYTRSMITGRLSKTEYLDHHNP